jgi:hypothetical protein
MPAVEPTCKTHPKSAPYQQQKPREKKSKDAPATSAKPIQSKMHKNLTLHDWITVFHFIDEHPTIGQADIVQHFRTRKEGALIFTQSTLSRKLKRWRDEPRQTQMLYHLSALMW